MEDKTSWFIKLWDESNPEIVGLGECGPLPGLSTDAKPDFENILADVLKEIQNIKLPGDLHQHGDAMLAHIARMVPTDCPAISFGLETAWLDLLNGGKRIVFKNSFLEGKAIPINGLVWMGDVDFMIQQVHQKIQQGFKCIKLKVGGLDFDKECQVLKDIRRQYGPEQITLRLDANGAFHPNEALEKLTRLNQFAIHSIEQPIKQGQEEMVDICRHSPIPVALDEELIGYESGERKTELLRRLRPQYIILKPTLHGGLTGCREWIATAEKQGIGWWITSALESNIGLNAICQFTANYPINLPHGLGTGAIYQNNIVSPLTVENGNIYLNSNKGWDVQNLIHEK
ncbi:o-succinylbenzoate synthase [Chryseolinea sp. H1M3-3]|uniref:o-succinylbenzoate synthase n=1 Tax=Chryseolinea sp. H1M3-3 TaxID=3034144 RepID=UPI0023EB14DE|nr:o-succinylbenzoate synthase [Chryseolinea sp. H1M3-3]